MYSILFYGNTQKDSLNRNMIFSKYEICVTTVNYSPGQYVLQFLATVVGQQQLVRSKKNEELKQVLGIYFGGEKKKRALEHYGNLCAIDTFPTTYSVRSACNGVGAHKPERVSGRAILMFFECACGLTDIPSTEICTLFYFEDEQNSKTSLASSDDDDVYLSSENPYGCPFSKASGGLGPRG